jgi:hypothetical protein
VKYIPSIIVAVKSVESSHLEDQEGGGDSHATWAGSETSEWKSGASMFLLCRV